MTVFIIGCLTGAVIALTIFYINEMLDEEAMRCSSRHPGIHPWLRGLRCRKQFDHHDRHAAWFKKKIIRWEWTVNEGSR